MSHGRIHQIVGYLERQHTSFAVSRLIMVSGVPVRKFGPSAEDPPDALAKLKMALRSILTPDDLNRMKSLLSE